MFALADLRVVVITLAVHRVPLVDDKIVIHIEPDAIVGFGLEAIVARVRKIDLVGPTHRKIIGVDPTGG